MPEIDADDTDLEGLKKKIKILEKDLAISHRNRAKLEDVREKNQRLLETVNEELEGTVKELKRAQASLVQSEKLAALGQLTAGIAHEIKNPLNFVNNFAEVSTELLEELQEELEPLLHDAKEDVREEARDLFETLNANLAKIKEHGARADGIVRGMLLHAREGPSSAASADLNGLLEECLNLAYHGMRAERQDFNVTIERELDPAVGQVELFPQEFNRVLLNIISNGFYAVHQRKVSSQEPDYSPVLTATTRACEAEIEIRIRDNGTGIPASAVDKIFEPFFTTKPAGQGTGLGLSLSYESVTQLHKGRMSVETREGEFTEFTISVPRKATLPAAEEA